MSEGKKLGRPFTPETAPRQGGKPGRRNRLSAQAMLILEKLMKDWAKHGARTLAILRAENPQAYARLAIETAAKLTFAAEAETVINDVSTIHVVKWGSASNPPPPPPEAFSAVSPFAPPALTLMPRPVEEPEEVTS